MDIGEIIGRGLDRLRCRHNVFATARLTDRNADDDFGGVTIGRGTAVRLSSGWLNERSACYLVARRPVVTQDFARPADEEGLFTTRAARAIAEQFQGRDGLDQLGL